VWAVEHSPFAKQPDQYAGAFTFGDFGSQFAEQCFNVFPLDVATDRPMEKQFQRFLVFAFHG
jgi:hypothetical protein